MTEDLTVSPPGPRPGWAPKPRIRAWTQGTRRRSLTRRSSALPKSRSESKALSLPGLNNGSRLVERVDAYSRRFAMLQVKGSVQCTVVFEAEPVIGEPSLAWESWIRCVQGNSMPLEVRTASATLESSRVGPAPALTGCVALTLTPPTPSRGHRAIDYLERRAAQYLPRLNQVLSASSDRTFRPVDAHRLSEMIQVAYDPKSEVLLHEAHIRAQRMSMEWSEVGPSVHRTSWDRMDHEGATSRTWYASEAGADLREEVAGWLTDAPGPSLLRKRATAVLDLRSDTGSEPDGPAFDRARTEGLIITATGEGEDVAGTTADLTPRSRLSLRLDYGSQDTAFVMGLPVGQAFLTGS